MLEGFLADIIAHPDDDTPRLVLADWLEDHGDADHVACAAFIRAQCRLAGMAPDHPDRPDLEACVLLNERKPAQRLANGVRGLARRWRFHRGLVEEVDLTVEALVAHGEKLISAAPVRRLNLTVWGLEGRVLASRPWLSGVRSLRLTWPSWGNQDTALLRSPHLTGLRELAICGVRSLDPGTLNHASWGGRLESLSFQGTWWAGGWGRLIKPGILRSLRLAGSWGDDPARHLQAVLPGLERLELLGVSADWILRLLSPPVAAPQVTSLSVRGPGLTGGRLARFLALPVVAQLRRLDLGGPLTSADLADLARCPHLGRLHELGLGGIGWGRGLAELVCSPHLRGLRKLSLRNSPWRALQFREDSRRVFEMLNLPGLGSLEITGFGFMERLLGALLRTPWLQQLYHLRLDRLAEAEAMKPLLEFGPWPRLARLDLPRGRMDFAAMRQAFGERLRY